MQEIYKFCPFKVVSEVPTGNHRLETKFPAARSGHRIVSDSSNIYSFGGYNPLLDRSDLDSDEYVWAFHCLLFKELWKFNIATKTWIKLKTSGKMPEELASHATALVGDTLVVFGGTGVPFGLSSSNSVHLCNLKSLEWFELATDGELPLQQYGQAIALDNHNLFVVGGTTGFEYSINVHILDLRTKQWSELVTSISQPEPRYRHEMIIENNMLFVFGGGTATKSFSMKEVPVFNISDQMWRTIYTSKNHPGPRRCHGCVRIDNDIYISGGQNEDAIFSDIWRINLNSMQWTKLPCELPEPVYFHSATVTPEGQMFIFGGVTSMEGNVRTNALHSVWLKIPTLKEICWQAALHYMPHIGNISKEHLHALGIPSNLLERIQF